MSEPNFAIEALRRCALFAQVDDETLGLCAAAECLDREVRLGHPASESDPGLRAWAPG